MTTTLERRPNLVRPEAPTPSWWLSFIKLHAVAMYYVLAFAISWGAILLAVGPDGFIGTADTIAVVGAASLAGPSIAGLLMTGLVGGQAGYRRLVSRLLHWRVGGRWYAAALLTAPVVMIVTKFAVSVAFPDARPDIVTADDKLGIVMTGITTAAMVSIFEELGWTGFAAPKLRRRHGVFATGTAMGLVWGAWHFPMFAGTADPSGSVPTALLVAALLFGWLPAYRVLMVWIYDRTESLLLAMLMHAPIVIAQYVLASEGVSGAATLAEVLVWGVFFWLIVAAVARWNDGNLTRRDEATGTQEAARNT